MKRLRILLMVAALSVSALACGMFNISRSDDGDLLVETNLSLQTIRTIIESSADLSNVVDMQLELREGYIYFSAASVEIQGITARDVTFHLELAAVNGKLSAQITNVQVSDNLFDDSMFEQFNKMIADRISSATQDNERAELVSVSISPESVKMTWKIDPGLGN